MNIDVPAGVSAPPLDTQLCLKHLLTTMALGSDKMVVNLHYSSPGLLSQAGMDSGTIPCMTTSETIKLLANA